MATNREPHTVGAPGNRTSELVLTEQPELSEPPMLEWPGFVHIGGHGGVGGGSQADTLGSKKVVCESTSRFTCSIVTKVARLNSKQAALTAATPHDITTSNVCLRSVGCPPLTHIESRVED